MEKRKVAEINRATNFSFELRASQIRAQIAKSFHFSAKRKSNLSESKKANSNLRAKTKKLELKARFLNFE